MGYEANVAAQYRAHAEELRAIAEADKYETTREMLILVAENYESMAENMDQLDARHGRYKPA